MPITNYCYQQYVDLQTVSGNSWDLPLSFTTGSYPSTTAQSIEGWTINLLVKVLQSDTEEEAVLDIDVTDHVDAINGLTAVYVSAAQTAELSGYYYYYLTWTDDSGGIQTFQYGKVNFTI